MIRTPVAGALSLDVAPPDATGLSTVLRSDEFDVVSFLRDEGGRRGAEGLSPGRYYVDVGADGMADACLPIEIRSGEETRVEFRLQPGVARTLEFRGEPTAVWSELRVSVATAEGRRIALSSLPQPFLDAYAVLVHLPVGEFAVQATSDTGLVARASFSVPSLTEQDAPLVFELR